MSLWLASLSLLVIVTYPTSPPLFALMGEWPEAVYLLFLAALLIVATTLKNANRGSADETQAFKRAGVASTSVCAMTYIANENATAIRDALTIAVICFFVLRIPPHIYIGIIRRYIILNAILLAIALTLLGACYVDLIDYTHWHVSNLGYLSERNPIYLRQDFSFHMPLYFLVIPFTDSGVRIFGFEFLRQPLIYTEPAYTWINSAGIFLFSMADKNIRGRVFILLALGVSLAVSASVQGFLAVVSILAILMIFHKIKLFQRQPLLFIALILIGIYSLIFYGFHELVLSTILPEKFEQYNYFQESLEIIHLLKNFPLFGVTALEGSEFLSYGSVSIIMRYGPVGFVVLCGIWLLLLVRPLKLLSSNITTMSSYLFAAAVMVSVIIMLRVPQFNQLVPMILLAGFQCHVGVRKAISG